MHQVTPQKSTATGSFASPSPFACSWKSDGLGSAQVHLVGELDLSTLPSFRETLREAQLGAGTVSIDLQDLEFIDCAGLGAIVDADERRDGSRLILERGSGQVDRVLRLTGLLERLEAVDFHLSTSGL
jgi:anti-anti-sigma factor